MLKLYLQVDEKLIDQNFNEPEMNILEKPLYIRMMWFTGVNNFFLILAENLAFWVLIETTSLRRFQRAETIYI